MNIIKYDSSYKELWNSFLVTSKNYTFLFDRDFCEYHSDRFEDYSLLVFNDKKEIVALLPANISGNDTVISHQGLTYGGLVIRKNDKLEYIIEIYKNILEYLYKNGIKILKYKEIPEFYNELPAFENQYITFLLRADNYRRDSSIAIDLRQPFIIQERRNRSIKKATKSGVKVIETDDFKEYWEKILTPNLLNRFGVRPVHSLEEVSMLAKKFPNKIRQFNAYLDGQIMAGTTIFETDNVAHAQYISGSNEGRKNGSLDYLFADLILNKFNEKKIFDFGICNEAEGYKVNRGLLDWKEGFGGRIYCHHFYKIETENYELLNNVFI